MSLVLLTLVQPIIAVLLALVVDKVLGEPPRYHPLVGFGKCATWLEGKINRSTRPNRTRSLLGGIAWCVLVILPAVIFLWLYLWLSRLDGILHFNIIFNIIILSIDVVVLYLAVGYRSLRQHARRVADALRQGDITLARQSIAMMVSRDTANMDTKEVTRATVESVLENGNDAIFAPIFWYLIAGAPAVMVYRLANTLDAMWGYKTQRFLLFGYCAAKIDDGLNWLPARLTALTYALSGSFTKALYCWRTQGHLLASPNGGPVMTAGAGALEVHLGGASVYHGVRQVKPVFGCGHEVELNSIERSLKLIDKALGWWLLTGLVVVALMTLGRVA